MQTKLVMLTFLFFIFFSINLFALYGPSVINGETGYITQEFEIHAGVGESSFEVTCSGTSDYDLYLYDEYYSIED